MLLLKKPELAISLPLYLEKEKLWMLPLLSVVKCGYFTFLLPVEIPGDPPHKCSHGQGLVILRIV